MSPRLLVLAGPLEGKTFPLSEQEVSLGRSSSNQIHIGDPSVSRRHCLIAAEGRGYRIRDLESENGTSVDGVPVKERTLEHGNHIRLGDSLFLFLANDEELPAPPEAQLEDTRLGFSKTVALRREDALYLQPTISAEPEPASRMAKDLRTIFQIGTAVASIEDLDELQRSLLRLIFEVTPAEDGAILLVEQGKEIASILGWSRDAGGESPVKVSRTIVDRVLAEGVAILSNELAAQQPFNIAASIIASRMRSLLAVPIETPDRLLGVIYLATPKPEAFFDEGHLELVTAVAAIAAPALRNALHMEWLRRENQRLQAQINVEHNMVGESRRMREVLQFISRVAPTDSTILIRGESGTGKELVANAIHRSSPRATRPFVAINCAAITDTLLESEMFGHEKGAFTGATAQKKGKLEVADGGTLFLDEVGEVTPAMQAKLLRVLQERTFERVGGTRSIQVNIRLLAATNRNLEEAVTQGTFRRDLYYRLNVVLLTTPPLRDRPEDIPLLASYFAARHSAKCARRVIGISPEARACMLQYDWPGNVRELENAIERAVVLGMGELLLKEDLPEALLEIQSESEGPGAGMPGGYHAQVHQNKKQIITKALEQAVGNITEAARLLGVHPNYLHRLIRNMNLRATARKTKT
ncbi:MAG: sigma 54-interacting transcriptional regulator [Bryobacteraceae bacterium]